MLEILEKIIPLSIYGFITTIAGGCIAILIQYIRLQYEVKKQETAINDLGKKIDNLIEIPGTNKLEETINNLIKLPRNEDLEQNITKLIELLSSNINKDEKESYLNSLEIQILEPQYGETITKEGSYTIKGIIRNIPEGMKFNNLSKGLGLYVLHTADGKTFWPQGDIQKDIDSSIQDGVMFYSSHYVNSSTKILIVLLGEKAQGAIAFYREWQRGKKWKTADEYQPISRDIIVSDIKKNLANFNINFNQK